MIKKVKVSLLIYFCLPLFYLYGQVGDDTIFMYKDILKNDDRFTLEEQRDYIQQAISYSERKGYIYEELFFREKEIGYYFSVADYDSLPNLSNELLKDVEENFGKGGTEEKWRRLHINALYDIGITNVFMGNYNPGAEAFSKISTLYPHDSVGLAKVYNGLGIISAQKNAMESALNYFNKGLDLYIAMDDKDGIYKTYSNIGLLYLSQDKYKESLSNFLKAHQIVVETGNTGEQQIYANHYMAMAYSGMENYEMANRFFVEAIKIAEAKHHKRLLRFSQYNYAKNLYKQKNYSQAEIEGQKALKYFRESQMGSMIAETLKLLANIYTEKGEYKTALEYEGEYTKMLEHFLKTEKEENLRKLESSLEDYKLQNKVIELELTKAKLSYRNLLIGVLAVISCLLLVGIIVLYRRFFTQRKLNNNAIQRIDEMNRKSKERVESIEEHLNEKIDVKNKELLSNALLFLRLNSVSATITEKLQILKKDISFKPKDKILIYEIENLISELSLDKDWGEFEMYFQQIDDDFFSKLSDKYPSLSPNEKRMCALFSLDLSNKDIATLMQKSLQSVSMAKIRIKRKLNVETNEEFVELLNSL